MSQQLGGQPIIILRQGTTRNRGQEAQNSNIAAAKAVANAVRSTLGPKGMDKMLIDGMGDIVITNDGATILQQMDIEHPAAKMMVEIAKTQDAEVGDGTTSAVVIAGELLKNAEDLLGMARSPDRYCGRVPAGSGEITGDPVRDRDHRETGRQRNAQKNR